MSYTTNANTEGVSVEYKENDMEVEKLGTKETEELIKALKDFVAEAKKVMADKKVTFVEAIGILPETYAVIVEGKDYKTIMDEIRDLDGEEAKEILCDLVDTIFASNEK